MRLRVVFYAKYPVFLPWHYPHLLHGFLYGAIARSSPALGSFLHEQGFVAGSHRYKMLVFSKLYPLRAQKQSGGLVFTPPIQWWASSPLPAAMEALAKTLLAEREISLGAARLEVERVEVEPPPVLTGRVLGRTISPVVASTGERRGEKLYKRFLSPEEPDFWRIIESNLRRKAEVLGLSPGLEKEVRFEKRGEWQSRLTWVQGAQVRGYEGEFAMEGEKELLFLAYEAGLGERNSQGFGMFRVLRNGGGEGK